MASGGVKALQCEVNGITTVPKLQTEQLHSLESILGKSEGMRSGLSKEPREGPRTKEGSMRTSGFFMTWYYLPLKNRDHVLYSIPPPPHPPKKNLSQILALEQRTSGMVEYGNSLTTIYILEQQVYVTKRERNPNE